MNQTMLAIFEANPQAFQGNINILSAGASLRLPSADDIYRIDRGEAVTEVRRQHYAWGGVMPPPPVTSEPFVATDTQPSLTLVPPDEEPIGLDTGIDTGFGDEPMTREQEVLDRIAELEAADVPIQRTLIEIRNNELAALRAELAEIRGEVYESPLDEPAFDDEFVADDTVDAVADDVTDVAPEPIVDEADTSVTQGPASVLSDDAGWLPSVDEIIGLLKSYWTIIAGAVLAVVGLLIWFLRRSKDEEEDSGAWDALDADEGAIDPLEATGSMQAPQIEEAMVVVEQDSAVTPLDDDTVRIDATDADPTVVISPDIGDTANAADETSQSGSLEDTFSSETAVNLDQSDPMAEADFHMAYGLYDQAADLINGALQVDPEGQDLLTKLCEIYFVWGNRDAFIDAADRLKAAVGGSESADWDKIVIMGQQIAADNELFAGAGVGIASQEVDLSFESESTGAGELDMDFGADAGVVDEGVADDLDFLFDDTAQSATISEDMDASGDFEVTAEMPAIDATADEDTGETSTESATVETPTIEEQFAGFDPTAEMPTIDDSTLGTAIEQSGLASDATAEINLDDLDLGIDALSETEMASLDDDIDDTVDDEALGDTDVYDDEDEIVDVTGKNPEVDPEMTGVQSTLDPTPSGLAESLKVEEEDLTATAEMRLAPDETGVNPMLNIAMTDEAGDMSDNDATLLGAGLQVDDGSGGLGNDEETQLASLDDEDDFDFAKTEALTPEVFTGNKNLDTTGEMAAMSNTDVDLDLDELTAALKIAEQGDTLEQPRDDATAEYALPSMSDDEVARTTTLGASELSDELQEARTMTEVGTKLDLARAYVDMGDPAGARSILDEVLDEGDESQRQQAQSLLETLPT
jgi:pilus assembly protein FimV